MKNVIIVILVVVLIVLIAMMFLWKPPVERETPPPPPEIPLAEQVQITSREIPSERGGQRIRINAKFPIISLSGDGNVSKKTFINDQIIKSVTPYYQEITVMTEDITITTKEDENDDLMNSKRYEYDVGYERYNNDVFLSLVVTQDIRISLGGNPVGGLRSNKWKDTYVVDCRTFDLVALKDICNFPNYKSVILDELNKQSRLNHYNLVGGSELTKLSDTQKFYIKDGKIIIYFEPASIAPYLLGDLEFEMPFVYDKYTHKFALSNKI